jgi:hypothetical protein
VAEKNNEIEMLSGRIKDLELMVAKKSNEFAIAEKKLRNEIEMLQSKASEIGSISNLINEGDSTSLASDLAVHNALLSNSQADRVEQLEKELNFFKTEYHMLKIANTLQKDDQQFSYEKCNYNLNHNIR